MNESKERDDVAFRIQERLLRQARLDLSYAREHLDEVFSLREHRDDLILRLSVETDTVAQLKAMIEKLRVDCANAVESLVKKDEMIEMLKKRVESVNNEYNNAYGIPKQDRRERAHVYDPPDVSIPTFKADPYVKIEIKNDHHS